MLRDTKLNPAYSKDRSTLQYVTARALALGNDITTYGEQADSLAFVTNTSRTYSNLSSLTKQTAIYPSEHILVNLSERYSEITYRPSRLRLRDRFIDTPGNRMMFWACYRGLRARGMSRRMIVSNIMEYLR